MPQSPEIPDKPYYRIGEVARIVGVEPHVLRFWEREFRREVRPERTTSGQRRYRRRDVEAFVRIKALREGEKLTIAGARRKLRLGGPSDVMAALRALAEDLIRVVDEDEASE